MEIIKHLARVILKLLYNVQVHGLEHYEKAGQRVLIAPNHTSFLDAVLLTLFLPDKLTFAINTQVSQAWWLRPVLRFVDFFPVNPANPYSLKSLIRYLQQDRRAVIFPEGRITVTGALMKIYHGPGLVADKSGAMLLPVRIEGAQYTPFSRLRGRVRLRWFPDISITILPPRRLNIPVSVRGRQRRKLAGAQLSDLMTEMMFVTSNYHRTVFQAVLDARRIHGSRHVIAEDIERRPLNYRQLIQRSFILARALRPATQARSYVGVLLPNAIATMIVFLGLHIGRRVPAMLNYTVGAQGMISACRTAKIQLVYTSRRFVEAAKLQSAVEGLSQQVKIVYLEDLRAAVGLGDKLMGMLQASVAKLSYHFLSDGADPQDPAVVLFTSGSEGTPKGVVLSHANILSNCEQIAARVPFSAQDLILNALPLFHSFGLMAGSILPLTSGMRVFYYPSPLHYRIVPEIAYDINATVMFGTNTFLAGYARFAHPYDFYSVRYVFAGAEKLHEETRKVWIERFGIRIFEGYGATETSPALSTNTPMDYRAGTVGRLFPGIEHRLLPVPGIDGGGRLLVRGPNVMLGYLLADRPGEIQAPQSELGAGWYDTGDIVDVDDDGFIKILGRAKRFAKVGGEMVSLTAVEELASRCWPNGLHAVVTLPDSQKGEQLMLLTTAPDGDRATLLRHARAEGVGEIAVPKRVKVVGQMPLLGSGKIDYPAVRKLVEQDTNS